MRITVACTLLLALLAAPASAFEPPQPLEPADGASLTVGSLPWFGVSAPDAALVRVIVTARRASGRPAPEETVAIAAAEPQPDGSHGRRLPIDIVMSVRPGRYVWHAEAMYPDGSTAQGPKRSLHIRPRAGATRRDRIPARLGGTMGGRLAVNAAVLPEGVGRERFGYLTRMTAHRWGLKATGWTSARPGVFDRRDVVGFSTSLPDRAVGLTTTTALRRYRRTVRCGGGGCVVVGRRYMGTSIVDRDVELDADLVWASGPDYPWPDEMDLESVLIHELGHFAGNRGHLPSQCANSPLVTYGSPGDWWHSPTDVFRAGCQRAIRARAAVAKDAKPRLRFEHRTVVREETTTDVTWGGAGR